MFVCSRRDVPPAEPPRVLKGLVDLEVKPGSQPITMECVIVGQPEPEVDMLANLIL